jgi:hypothetical protein
MPQHFESHFPPADDATSGASGDKKTGERTSASSRLAAETLRRKGTGLEAGGFTLLPDILPEHCGNRCIEYRR